MTRRSPLPSGVAVLVLLLGLAPGVARSQDPPDAGGTREVYVEADSLVRSDEGGEPFLRLLGNVRVRQDSTLLESQQALQYIDRDQFLFTGQVVVIERGDTLRADEVLYDRPTKVGEAQGRVRLSDGDVVVHAPSGRYFTREKRAVFEEGLTLVDSLTEVTSRGGTYWSDEKRAEVYGAVRLEGDRTHLEADSLTYFRETEVSFARGDVFIERLGGEDEEEADTTTRTLLFSDRAHHDEQARRSLLEGHPLLVQLRQDSTGARVDTLVIAALRIEAAEEDSLRRLVAVDSVRIWQTDLAALADSVVYERVEARPQAGETEAADSSGTEVYEETRLYRAPVVWLEETQISGDTVRVKARDGAADSLFVRGGAFTVQQDSATGRLQQLRGQDLDGVFPDDSTRLFTVGPTAEAIYYRVDEEDRPDGAVRVSGDRIRFRVRGDEADRIKVEGEVQGTYYAEELVPAAFELEGLRWRPDDRPTRDALLGDERAVRRLGGARPGGEQAVPPDPGAVSRAGGDGQSQDRP